MSLPTEKVENVSDNQGDATNGAREEKKKGKKIKGFGGVVGIGDGSLKSSAIGCIGTACACVVAFAFAFAFWLYVFINWLIDRPDIAAVFFFYSNIETL